MKNRYVLALDLLLIAAAAFGAYAARFDWRFYEQRPEFILYVGAVLVIKPAIFAALGRSPISCAAVPCAASRGRRNFSPGES